MLISYYANKKSSPRLPSWQPSLISVNTPIDSGSIIKPCTLKHFQVPILAPGLQRIQWCRIYASVNWVSIGSGNGLSPLRRQALPKPKLKNASKIVVWQNVGHFVQVRGVKTRWLKRAISETTIRKTTWKLLIRWVIFDHYLRNQLLHCYQTCNLSGCFPKNDWIGATLALFILTCISRCLFGVCHVSRVFRNDIAVGYSQYLGV